MINPNSSRLNVHPPGETKVRERVRTKEQFAALLKSSGEDIVGVDFDGLKLGDADLSGRYLHDVRIEKCDFTGAKLMKTCIDRSTLVEVEFTNADLTGARLKDCNGWTVRMNGAKLDKAGFENCDLTDCSFYHATLCDTRMHEGSFRKCDFEYADLSGTCIRDVAFVDTSFKESRTTSPAFIRESRFENVSWCSANVALRSICTLFDKVDFTHANLDDSRFMYCTLRGPMELERCRGFSSLIGCQLEGVNLLQLQWMPFLTPDDQRSEQEWNRYRAYRDAWKSVINWREPVFLPEFDLSVDLAYYKNNIAWFDAEMRRCLRDKVQKLALDMPELRTEESSALLREIIALDDAMTVMESKRPRAKSAGSLHLFG